MPGNNYFNLAKETNFAGVVGAGAPAAPATGWHGVAVEDLGGHKIDVPILQPNLMLYGQQGPTSRGRRAIKRGATGAIKTYLASSGLLLLLELMFGPPVTTELEEDEAYSHVFETGPQASTTSAAVQLGRNMKGSDTPDRDTLVGGQATAMHLSQSLIASSSGTSDEGLSKISFDMAYAAHVTAAQHLPTYPDPDLYYSGGDHKLWVGESLDDLELECLNAWTLNYDQGLDLGDADACISSIVRDRAGRGPDPKGSIEAGWAYKGRKYFDAYLNGELLALRSKWEPTGALEISAGIKPSVTVDVACVGLTGDTPEESKDSSTKQNLPMDILWNEEDPMIKVTVITPDATVV